MNTPLEVSPARGKWLVAVILVGSLLFLGFALWFFLTQSPPDQRFNMIRDPVPSQLQVADLLPSALGDMQMDGTPVPSGGDGSMAKYMDTNDNSLRVQLAVQSLANAGASADKAQVLTTAACGDGKGKITLHTDAQIPFAYATCPQNASAVQSNFAWINGQWLFVASGSDPEALLQFVNAYPY